MGRQDKRRKRRKKQRRRDNKRSRNEQKTTQHTLDSHSLVHLESAAFVLIMRTRFQGTTLRLSSALGKFRIFDRDFPCTFHTAHVDAGSTCGDIEVRIPLSGHDTATVHFELGSRITVSVTHDVAARLIGTIQSRSLSA